ncbi:MAG: energy transducer TonB [Nitrospirae bacterium]|nr:energy transducer TonB [Nitrospirota bacterium]
MLDRYITISILLHALVFGLILYLIKGHKEPLVGERPLMAKIVTPDVKAPPPPQAPPQQRSDSQPQPRPPQPQPQAAQKVPPPPPQVKPVPQSKPVPHPPRQPKIYTPSKPKETGGIEPTARPILPKSEPSAAEAPPQQPPSQPSPQAPKLSGIGSFFDKDIIGKHAMASIARDRSSPNSKEGSGNSISFDTSDIRYAAYMRRLKEAIESAWQYPADAARRGIHGDLNISFTINKNGTLKAIDVMRTSGQRSLDDAAVSSVKDAAPFWPLPEEWGKDSFTVKGHFVYRLHGQTLN